MIECKRIRSKRTPDLERLIRERTWLIDSDTNEYLGDNYIYQRGTKFYHVLYYQDKLYCITTTRLTGPTWQYKDIER